MSNNTGILKRIDRSIAEMIEDMQEEFLNERGVRLTSVQASRLIFNGSKKKKKYDELVLFRK